MPDVSLIIDYGKEIPALRGFGRVYQGGGPDIGLFDYHDERPRMLVQMARDIGSLQCKELASIFFVGIDDGPSGVLPDEYLFSLINLCCTWLRFERDCTFGCVMGVSRSGYINAACMMMLTGWPYDHCIERIRQSRAQVNPMQCFVDQLRRIEPQIVALHQRT